MKINESYKDLQCIKKMTRKYSVPFFTIVEEYAPRLSQHIVLEGSAYTLHDFNHHCINIYKCISEMIFNDKIAYSKNGLTQKELYILNLAVLFHDYGMTAYVDSKRDNHSYHSAQKVKELYECEESVFAKNVGLNLAEIRALKEIIIAHSDIKDGTVPEEQRGLNSPNLNNKMQASTGTIRGMLLASILRLADEMDVTEERIGQTSIERNLHDIEAKLSSVKRQKRTDAEDVNESTEMEIARLYKLVDSLGHWKKLHLFYEWQREKDTDEVFLVINDEYIKKCRIEGDTYESLADDIVGCYKKIKDELEKGLKQKINKEAERLNLKAIIAIDKITLFTKSVELENEIKNRLIDTFSVSAGEEVRKEENGRKNDKVDMNLPEEEHRLPPVVDEEFADKFSEIVKKRHLIKVGHFLLNNTYCARDWVATKEIVETQSIMDEMVFKIVKSINSDLLLNKENEFRQNCLIVGLDLEGAVIAARVAMALQMAFSYIIPAKDLSHNAIKEKEIQFEHYRKIVLITDAIVTYETIDTSLNYIGISEKDYDRIERIYTVFYRDSMHKPIEVSKLLLDKTYCICNSFNIELFEKSKCIYNKDECFGENM